MNKSWLYWAIALSVIFSIHSCSPKKKNDHAKKATAFKDLGVAYMKDNMDAAAFNNLTKAVSLNPNDPHIHFALGFFYSKKENYKQAIAEYKKCLELQPDFPSVHNNLCRIYLLQGEYDTSIECFKKLIGNYAYATPYFPLFSIGCSYFYKSEYRKAIKYFKEALDIEPDFSQALLWLGRSYIKEGNSQKAITALLKGTRIAPRYVDMHFYLGRAYRMSKDYRKANRAFMKVIEIDPDSETAVKAKKYLVQ